MHLLSRPEQSKIFILGLDATKVGVRLTALYVLVARHFWQLHGRNVQSMRANRHPRYINIFMWSALY